MLTGRMAATGCVLTFLDLADAWMDNLMSFDAHIYMHTGPGYEGSRFRVELDVRYNAETPDLFEEVQSWCAKMYGAAVTFERWSVPDAFAFNGFRAHLNVYVPDDVSNRT